MTRVVHTERKREHAGGWVYWVRGDGDVVVWCSLLFRGFREEMKVMFEIGILDYWDR
jgi:hypothetical protein